MKKKLLTFILMICLVLPVTLLFTACGGSKSYTATLEADELYFGNSKENKTANSSTGEVSLRGPSYYDYSEIKVLADGNEINGLFTLADIYYDNNDVYIGTFNPKKLSANATITVKGIKDRIARFTYMDFVDTKDYKDLKERYEGYLNTYTINNARADDTSLSEDERGNARGEANSAKSSIEYYFDGNMNGFDSWYASKSAFTTYYELKLSEKDRLALTTAPLKDKTLSNSTTKYESLVSEDGYIGVRYLSKIKNANNSAYQFEYTYKELTTFDEYGYTMGMLPIRSLLPLGRDTISSHNSYSSGSDATLHFNNVRFLDYDENDQAIYGKESEYDRESVLSVDVYGYSNHITLGDDYAHRLYLRIYDLHSNNTYAIDPTYVKYSKFSVMTNNQYFNGFAKLQKSGFTVKDMGDSTYTIDQLGHIYIFTDENDNSWVVENKYLYNKITLASGETVYFSGTIKYDADDNAMLDVEWVSYMYYDHENNYITSGGLDVTDENLELIKKSMVEDKTDEANILVTVNDIDYYYESESKNGSTEEFSASVNSYEFDMLLDSEHDIDWTNAKVKVGGYANNSPVNLAELTGDYGSYELKEYKVYDQGTLKTVKVFHCVLNLYKSGSMINVTTADDVYYPIHFVNKADLMGSFGVGRESYITYFVQVEGADFSNATGMAKIKGTSNVNPDAFAYYENSNMSVYKNADGTAYVVLNGAEMIEEGISGSYFAIHGQNFYDQSTTGPGSYNISDISSMTIGIKRNGTTLKNINVKNYLTDTYKYNMGDPGTGMYGGNGGYKFTETDGDYKYHVFVHVEESMYGENQTVNYVSEVIIIVESNSSQNLEAFFEFKVNLVR